MILTLIIGFLVSIGINLFLYRHISVHGGGVVKGYRLALLLLTNLAVLAVVTGSRLNPTVLVLCYSFTLAFLVIETLAEPFWKKMGYGSLGVLYLMLGGYLYTITQIPYGERPFAEISGNQPKPLIVSEMPVEWISGLPLMPEPDTALAEMPAVDPSNRNPAPRERQLEWAELEPLMARDSHIRDELMALKERQRRDLTEVLATLNQISVAGTQMRRHGIDRTKIENLLRDGAISEARYQTILETWDLTDQDERSFRSKLAEERFRAVLGLLEEKSVDETHKVELIHFMVARFAGDVRLVKPLIHLYESLDVEYPRQKRLNREFMTLYQQKRRAILQGFDAISHLGLQPLLDFRRKTISEIRYSQVFLDRFLERKFGIRIRPLYGVARPVSVNNFLNREKYPALKKLSGAAYEQDYLRRNLIKTAAENLPPEAGKSVMGLSADAYAGIARAFGADDPDRIDELVIDSDPVVRANLAWYLANRKDPFSIPLIFELMEDPHPDVRRLAAIASGNFRILDMQSSNDRKFTEIVRMLVNYRSNTDTFARTFALSALVTVGDRQKALYTLDLILNDGKAAHSSMGEASPTWKDEDEKAVVHSLVETLKATPEELYVKTHALKVLLAMESNDSLNVLMHYLDHIYKSTDSRPSMLRYIVPHMTLPQEAENVEDMVLFLASRNRAKPEPLRHPLKTLRAYLAEAYENHDSAEFFQYLLFLREFDQAEFEEYVDQTAEHVLLMRIKEYVHSTYGFWIGFWMIAIALLLLIQYGWGLFLSLSPQQSGRLSIPNRHANPAADIRNRRQSPAAAVVPIKIIQKNS